MKYLIYDSETTISNKGNPFDKRNRLCYSGLRWQGGESQIVNHLTDGPSTELLQECINAADFLVAFNAKFDCHWLESIGVDLRNTRIWDCQYGEYLFSNQLVKYPSLNGASEKYGLGTKIDIVATEYWEKGIDTIDIPTEIMVEYLDRDLILTEKLLTVQQEQFNTTKAGQRRLFMLHMEDQHVLREMEKNGIFFNTEESLRKEKETAQEVSNFKEHFDVPDWFNFDSGDHLSAYLYGGTIGVDTRVPVGVYKSGDKVGQVRYKIVTHNYEFPQLFTPIKGSELKKEGFYSTDENTLAKLRGNKEAKRRIGLLDKRAKLEKLRGTYYEGFPKTIAAMGWEHNMLHSSLNQCVAVTGRLSSTKPNQQNMPPECKQLAETRFS